MIASARRDWARFDGKCASRGVDPLELPLDRLCNLVWHWITEHRKPDEVDRIEADLWRPPPGTEASSGAWSASEELSAFTRAAQDARPLRQGAPVT